MFITSSFYTSANAILFVGLCCVLNLCFTTAADSRANKCGVYYVTTILAPFLPRLHLPITDTSLSSLLRFILRLPWRPSDTLSACSQNSSICHCQRQTEKNKPAKNYLIMLFGSSRRLSVYCVVCQTTWFHKTNWLPPHLTHCTLTTWNKSKCMLDPM